MTRSFDEMLHWAQKNPGYWQEDLRILVANAINDEMKRQGVNKAELARRLESSPSYITKILGGQQNLSLDSLAKVAFHLGLRWNPVLAPFEQERGKVKIKQTAPARKQARTAKTATVAALRATRSPRKAYSKRP